MTAEFTMADVLSHPTHSAKEWPAEVRFWLPGFDKQGRQVRRPWWDQKVIHAAFISGQQAGFWEWKSGVPDSSGLGEMRRP